MNKPDSGHPLLESLFKVKLTLYIISGILILGLCYLASSVFIPLAFALFIIALIAPTRQWLCRFLPPWLASMVTLIISALGVILLLYMAGWGFNLIAQWATSNAARFQKLFNLELSNLHSHGSMLLTMLTDSVNVTLLLKAVQEIALRLNIIFGLAFLTIIFVALGLIELDEAPGRIQNALGFRRGSRYVEATKLISRKLRRYMMIRTIASALTGLSVWLFLIYVGLDLAAALGALAFLLNYIPIVGSLVATVIPSAFAFIQFESWQTGMIVFIVLNVIQVIVGCYMEPRLAGTALSLSPLMVMLAVFFWGLVWGIPGIFIGVPLLITFVTILETASGTNETQEIVPTR